MGDGMIPTAEIRICARMREFQEGSLWFKRTRRIRDYNTVQQKFIDPESGEFEWRELPVHEVSLVG